MHALSTSCLASLQAVCRYAPVLSKTSGHKIVHDMIVLRCLDKSVGLPCHKKAYQGLLEMALMSLLENISMPAHAIQTD